MHVRLLNSKTSFYSVNSSWTHEAPITELILSQTKTEKTKQTMQRWVIYGNLPTRDSSIMLLKSQTEKKTSGVEMCTEANQWQALIIILPEADGARSVALAALAPSGRWGNWLPWYFLVESVGEGWLWNCISGGCQLNATPFSRTWVRLQAQDQWHKQLLSSLRLELHFILVRLYVILSKLSQALLGFLTNTHTLLVDEAGSRLHCFKDFCLCRSTAVTLHELYAFYYAKL